MRNVVEYDGSSDAQVRIHLDLVHSHRADADYTAPLHSHAHMLTCSHATLPQITVRAEIEVLRTLRAKNPAIVHGGSKWRGWRGLGPAIPIRSASFAGAGGSEFAPTNDWR